MERVLKGRQRGEGVAAVNCGGASSARGYPDFLGPFRAAGVWTFFGPGMLQLRVMARGSLGCAQDAVSIAGASRAGFEPLGCALLVLDVVLTPSREKNGGSDGG